MRLIGQWQAANFSLLRKPAARRSPFSKLRTLEPQAVSHGCESSQDCESCKWLQCKADILTDENGTLAAIKPVDMRTDAQIDRKQVKCPNVTLLGYNRWKARHGYIVVWNDEGTKRLARVVGRVAYAPECGSRENGTYTPAVRNYLMLVVLNTSATSKFIRWVNPDEIVECYSPEDYASRIQATISRFLEDDFIRQSPDAIASELGC
jgi:hypothetical protein